jgi:hypothetical protein
MAILVGRLAVVFVLRYGDHLKQLGLAYKTL